MRSRMGSQGCRAEKQVRVLSGLFSTWVRLPLADCCTPSVLRSRAAGVQDFINPNALLRRRSARRMDECNTAAPGLEPGPSRRRKSKRIEPPGVLPLHHAATGVAGFPGVAGAGAGAGAGAACSTENGMTKHTEDEDDIALPGKIRKAMLR